MQSEVNTQQAKTNEDVAKSSAKTDKLEKLVNDTSVTGTVFADPTSQAIKDHGVKKAGTNGFGFDVKRAYIGVNHQFNDTYSANITTDFQYSSAVGATELYIKKAYVQGVQRCLHRGVKCAADMPWVLYAEATMGTLAETILADRLKTGTSSTGARTCSAPSTTACSTTPCRRWNGGGYKNLEPQQGRRSRSARRRIDRRPEHRRRRLPRKLGRSLSVQHAGRTQRQPPRWPGVLWQQQVPRSVANTSAANRNRVLLGAAVPPSTVGGYGLLVYNPPCRPTFISTSATFLPAGCRYRQRQLHRQGVAVRSLRPGRCQPLAGSA